VQEARSLAQVSEQVEEALPAVAHRELAMRAVPMKKERLAKDGEVPVEAEEQQDDHDMLPVRYDFPEVRQASDEPSPVEQPRLEQFEVRSAHAFVIFWSSASASAGRDASKRGAIFVSDARA
jgi:hypothetical protein